MRILNPDGSTGGNCASCAEVFARSHGALSNGEKARDDIIRDVIIGYTLGDGLLFLILVPGPMALPHVRIYCGKPGR